MNYITTAIGLIASSAIGLTFAATECWAQIPSERSIPSPVETTSANIEQAEQLSLNRICRATGVVALGGSPQNLAVGGAAIVLSDGTVGRVIKIIAGNAITDVAIVQLDKQNLPWIPIAESKPAIVMTDPNFQR